MKTHSFSFCLSLFLIVYLHLFLSFSSLFLPSSPLSLSFLPLASSSSFFIFLSPSGYAPASRRHFVYMKLLSYLGLDDFTISLILILVITEEFLI